MRASSRDIEIELAGQRMAWRAASERGRAWVDAHPDLTTEAPEGVECLTIACGPLIRLALTSGLAVRCGDVRVNLC